MLTVTFPPAPLTAAAATDEPRTVRGVAVPWGVEGTVSNGQRVRFQPGALSATARPLVLRDHDRSAPVGRVVDAVDTGSALLAAMRLSAVPAGDQALVLAADGILGLSVGAEPTSFRFDGDVMVVDAADWVELSLVPFAALAGAVITSVTATAPAPHPIPSGEPMSVVEAPAPAPVAPVTAAAPSTPVEVVTPTAAAAVIAAAPVAPVVVTAEAFPYTFDGVGPSMVYDGAHPEDPEAATRLHRAQAMLADRRGMLAAAQVMAARGRRRGHPGRIEAAPATTVTNPQIVPPGYRPDLWTPLVAYEAPVWSALTHMPIGDFRPFTIPTEVSRAGLSGTPVDEITPVAPGTITTGLATVTPQHVMGKYQFSRDLDLASNPAIDAIAMNALDESWLLDVEARAVAFFTTPANGTARAATYATGAEAIKAFRRAIATFRVTRRAPANVLVTPGGVEWVESLDADDSADRPLLGWGQSVNSVGGQSDGAADANILGVPFLPDGSSPLPAKTTLLLARSDAIAFVTPVWNFRFEADATNPLVISLVKYSGVAFWTRRLLGVQVVTNTAVLPLADDAPASTVKGK